MRDPKRINVFCNLLREKWSIVPDWRFGQLMSNFLSCVVGTHEDIFFIEDDEMMKLLEEFFTKKD